MALFFKIVHCVRFFWIATIVAYILYILYGIVTYLYSGQPWSFGKATDYLCVEPWNTLSTIYIIQKIVEAFTFLFSNSSNPANK